MSPPLHSPPSPLMSSSSMSSCLWASRFPIRIENAPGLLLLLPSVELEAAVVVSALFESRFCVVVVAAVVAVILAVVVLVVVVVVVVVVVADVVLRRGRVFCLAGLCRLAGEPPELVLVEVEDPAAAAAVQPLELHEVEVEEPPDGLS